MQVLHLPGVPEHQPAVKRSAANLACERTPQTGPRCKRAMKIGALRTQKDQALDHTPSWQVLPRQVNES
jgi:hypothetical protein